MKLIKNLIKIKMNNQKRILPLLSSRQFMILLVGLLSACASNKIGGIDSPDYEIVGTSRLKVDACRSYREALIGHVFQFDLKNSKITKGLKVQGEARFAFHLQEPDEKLVRTIRDRTGDIYSEDEFYLAIDRKRRCLYIPIKNSAINGAKKTLVMEPLLFWRRGDVINVGEPGSPEAFSLAPLVIDAPGQHVENE